MPSLAAEPAAHAPPSAHATGKTGASPPPGAVVKGVGPNTGGTAGSRLHDMRQGDTTLHNSPTANAGPARPTPVKPAGTLGLGATHGPAPARTTGQISGTGVAKKGVGPASVGVTAKPRTGINGTGMGK